MQAKTVAAPNSAPLRWAWRCVGGLALLTLAACSSAPVVMNPPLGAVTSTPQTERANRLPMRKSANSPNRTTVILAFSGGGTRAAALSYGVLKGLRNVPLPGQPGRRLLDEVDAISAVSGGSFTAAYYALKGDAIFDHYERDFLKADIERELKDNIFTLAHLLSRQSRSQKAMRVYDKRLFHGANFSDLTRPNAPVLIINASDLGQGARFSYTQEYFDLLCSDLNPVPLAQAVTASSAVPLVFSPVLLKNYQGCETHTAQRIDRLASRSNLPAPLVHNLSILQRYSRHDRAHYLHLIDGGVTDNLGLRALYDLMAANGGVENFWQRLERPAPRRFVIISVDGMRSTDLQIDASPESPSLLHTVQAVTDMQMDRYSADTLSMVSDSAQKWVQAWSKPGAPVELYFLHLHFKQLQDSRLRDALYLIPTALTLPEYQVDELITTGENLLRSNPEFERLLRDLGASPQAIQSATMLPAAH
ncbi:MAG: patatin-like phospholipase family protein [Brachymonas sp.]